MAAFNANSTLRATLTALKAGETKIAELFALTREQAESVALAATAHAAKPEGYADIRLLLARMSWRASVDGKAGKAPSWILRSSTSQNKTTISVRDYVYNASKARGNNVTPAAASTPDASTPAAGNASDASDASDDSTPTVDHAATIAALQSELARVQSELTAERAAHDATRAELATARTMLAALPPRTSARRSAPAPVSTAATPSTAVAASF